MKNLNENVGKLLIALNLNTGTTPTIETIKDSNIEPEKFLQDLNLAFKNLLEQHLGVTKNVLNKPLEFSLHTRTGIIKSAEERKKEWDTILDALHSIKEPEKAPNPDDGKTGYWLVNGIRHSAVVLASTEKEAIKNAEPDVQDWESPNACFKGEKPLKISL